ncbi:MAG: 2-dehydropantoate 2-reductase [Actinobacteria bacterium]|nr:2-dehydropantoate 2-reductase [Actinomycetota bacterium]
MGSHDTYTVAVVGAGALGCVYAALLERTGVHVTLVTRRSEVAERIASDGVTVEDHRSPGAETLREYPEVSGPDDVPGAGRFDAVLLLNKADDAPWATNLGLRLVADDGLVVSLQNGLRSAELVESADPRGVAGTTYQGATHLAPGIVAWTGEGPTLLAPRPDAELAAERFASIADQPELPVRIVDDRDVMLWEKLALATANSVSGALMLPVHEMLQAASVRRLMALARAEVYEVAGALDVRLDTDRLESFFGRGAPTTTRTAGSTYQSLVSGRPSEAADISGVIVERAHEARVDVPVNLTLDLLVRARAELLASSGD